MADDLYSHWLKIPPGARPPDHYSLLGLPRFCEDVEKIESSAQTRLDALDRYALHPDQVKRDACQQIMNEVARARVVLINPQKRQAYDLTLKPAKPAPPPPVVAKLEKKPAAPARPAPVARVTAAPITQAAPISVRPAVANRPPQVAPRGIVDLARVRLIAPIAGALVAVVVVVAFILHRIGKPQDTPVAADHQPPDSRVSSAVPVPSVAIGPPVTPTVQRPAVAPIPSPPVTPSPLTPSPVTPAAVVPGRTSAAAVSTLPVPEQTQRIAARKLVSEIFAEEIDQANTADGKATLAKKMLAMAARTDDDPPGAFELLSRAGDLATQGGDADTALAAIAKVAKRFQIDGIKVKARALITIAEASATPRKNAALALNLDTVLGEALVADRYDLAGDLAAAAISAATEAKDQAWLAKAQLRARTVVLAKSEYPKYSADRAILEKTPADADANLHVGSFRCFIKEDWFGGLPMLANGSDAGLKRLAEADMDRPNGTAKLIDIGDGWWSQSEIQPPLDRPAIKRHAVDFYRRVLPRTSDPTRARLQERYDAVKAADKLPP